MATTSYPLGSRFPPEIANIIMLHALDDDRTAVILPRQICTAGAPRDSSGTLTEEITITSRCALFRATKSLRALYIPMFMPKYRDMDVDRMIVKVEDFDINAFWTIFQGFVQTQGPATARAFPYEFHLSFTDDFLHVPNSAPLINFANKWSGMAAQRFMHINYTVRPIPIQYVDNLRVLLNEQHFQRTNMLDPEFKHLFEVFGGLYKCQKITRKEDKKKDLVGYWVQERFVIKEAHEWKDEDFVDDQGEPLLRFD